MNFSSAPRTLYAPDGMVDWQAEQDKVGQGPVVRIIVGRPQGEAAAIEETGPKRSQRTIGDWWPDLAASFPALTHLYVWGQVDLVTLPPLPSGLQCLDVRNCSRLASVHDLPSGLDTLVLDNCPSLDLAADRHRTAFPRLRDLSIRSSTAIEEAWVHRVLKESTALSKFDAWKCNQIRSVPVWPEGLADLSLGLCDGLTRLDVLPPRLRRLVLRDAARLTSLPPFPATIDCVDLSGTASLKHPIDQLGSPRTLHIHGSGLDLPQELLGDDAESNVARRVLAYRAELAHGAVDDDEVKVFLLGNGRCGKSSLLRRLVEDTFDERELTTHGIQLRTIEGFPLDGTPNGRTARLNLWDFAGQDLYHNTHRLFLQSKAVHLLCWTGHGDGSRPDNDHPADLLEEPDTRRSLRYWREQVTSLGPATAGGDSPPMLVVRTKVDRDAEAPRRKVAAPQAARGLPRLDVSAVTGAGVDELRDQLRRAAIAVLGPSGRTKLGQRPMAVKRAIQTLKDENDRAFHRAVSSGSRAEPPHPFLRRREFDALVREHCADGPYFEDPGLLLDFLHQGGFVYANPQHLPDHVILDQRWAVEGIYTLFHRRHCWALLREARGRFTAAELAEWAWDEAGYTPAEQALFLEFMLACELCFELLPAHEARDGQAVYLAPAALPEGSDPRVVEEAGDQRGDVRPGPSVVLGDDGDLLSRDAVMQLLVRLGRQWRRTAVMWRWGGQFRSFRTRGWATSPTFVHADWQAHARDSYGGALTLTLYGRDESFLDAVLDVCRETPGFAGIRVPERAGAQWRRVDRGGARRRRSAVTSAMPAAGPTDRAGAADAADHVPQPPVATGVAVGISFAGDAKDTDRAAPCAPASLPEDSIERWPRLLAQKLRERGFAVEDYRTEQGKPIHEREPALKRALDRLTARDFMVVFLSWKYLQSPICMYEFLRIRGRMQEGHDPTVLRLGAFKDGLCWADNRLEGEGQSVLGRFRDHWEAWRTRFWEKVKADLGKKRSKEPLAPVAEAKTYAFYDWVEFLDSRDKLDGLIADLRAGFQTIPVQPAPTDEDLDEWCKEIAANTGRFEVLFKYAADGWQAANAEKSKERRADGRKRALAIFEQALERQAAGPPARSLDEILKEPFDDDLLDDMRRAVQEARAQGSA